MYKDHYYTYIMTNSTNSVLYVGVTGNLTRRALEHANGNGCAFTKKYRVRKLVYFEEFQSPFEAIEREKCIKGWTRDKKIALISARNPRWNNLLYGVI